MADAILGQYSQYCPECGRRLVLHFQSTGTVPDGGPITASCSSRLCGWTGSAPKIQRRKPRRRKAGTHGAKD